MSQIIPYLFIYYGFIDSQQKSKMTIDKAVPFFVKSKALFYYRLLMQDVKNQYVALIIVCLLLIFGIMLQAFDPILLVLFSMMYLANATLQYSKLYRYLKYFLYFVPLGLFMLDRIDFVYVATSVIAGLTLFLLFTFQLKLYQRQLFWLEQFDFRDKKVLLGLGGIMGFIAIILFINYYSQNFPIEEAITFLLVVFIELIEADLAGNKMLLTKVKTRFNLIRIKSANVSFNFLIPKQKNRLWILLTGAFLSTLVLGVMQHNYFTYFLLFIGTLMFFLYIIDYIVQCLLLEKSIVYENALVKAMIDAFFSFALFTYIIAFIINKYISGANFLNIAFKNEYIELLAKMQIGYVILYVAFAAFFFYRLYQSFAINKTSFARQSK